MASQTPDAVACPAGKRGPKTAAGKARSARNALKHGLRAAKYPVLPDESPAEFAAHEAALIEELAPVGALQTMLARRVAVAAWRLAWADRIEADLFKERSWGPDATPGIALIRDGNGTRSFETLLRYRGAAMAEFSRALRTLKALQAEQAKPVAHAPGATLALAPPAGRPVARRTVAAGSRPNEPCLAELWHGGGAPTPCTGWARGVGDRNEPRDGARRLA
jgi:hypothetical protein